ncbi:MAG: glycosyltransferase [Planctomycetes bacterium]|nr:glycosyltransferase [Planctomycetota bacterium]
MRVLMLGWEFPPFISGGLGTACYGLTRAMSRQNIEVVFVLPKPVPASASASGHVKLVSPASPLKNIGHDGDDDDESISEAERLRRAVERAGVEFRAIPSPIASPYPAAPPSPGARRKRVRFGRIEYIEELDHGAYSPRAKAAIARIAAALPEPTHHHRPPAGNDYAGNVVDEAQRYAHLALRLARAEHFDVIHAHDWMTYPAALAVAGASGRPLVVHVHSTEFDRSGEHVNQQIYDIERRGMHGAISVVCVSYLTRNICIHRYGVPASKVHVVYNGIESDAALPPRTGIRKADRIVLFLGRITMQKGPEYFVAAAKKVLDKIDNVKFVMAGSGDMAQQVIAMAAEMDIGHKVLFTGFLRGADVEKVFRMADVYVMPSVSEPFGIAPLEAIRHDVPVIISRNSGVAEVIQHALKVDFWDVDDMADKIIAVLRHPPLSQTMREHADIEARQLTWDGAAHKCMQIYQQSLRAMMHPAQALR